MSDKKITILYVEDDDDTRDELSLFLQQKCDVLYVSKNGKDGLETYKKHSPDLVISDIQMPILSGIDMAKQIRKLNQFVPIILITAFNETSYLKTAVNINITSYITKPVDLRELDKKIDEILHPEFSFIVKFSTNGDIRIQTVEGNWKDIVASSDELIGKPLSDFVLDSHKNEFKLLMEYMKNNGFLHREKISFLSHDKTILEYLVDGEKIHEDLYKIHLIKMEYFIHSYSKIQQLIKKEKDLWEILRYKQSIHEQTISSSTVKEFYDKICSRAVESFGFKYSLVYEESQTSANEYILSGFSSSENDNTKYFKSKFTLNKDDKMMTNTPFLIESKDIVNYPFFEGILKPNSQNKLIVIPIFLYKDANPMGFYFVFGKNFPSIIKNRFYKGETIGLTIGIGKQMIENRIKF